MRRILTPRLAQIDHIPAGSDRPPLVTVDRMAGLRGIAQRRVSKIVIDVALLVGFLAEFITREGPDYTIHSWIGIVLVPIVVVHLAGNLGWIQRVWARKREDREFGLGVLNAVLGALTAICTVTGFPIWLDWGWAGPWSAVHQITGLLAIVLMFAHLWKNRGRIGRLIRA